MEANELRYRGPSGNDIPGRPTTDLDQEQKKKHAKDTSEGGTSVSTDGTGVMYGRTPKGTIFKVPTTHSFVHTLSHTIFTSQLTQLTLLTLGFQLVIFWYLPRFITGPFFLLYFAFWRTAYDAGLGYVLRKQSEKKWIVRKLQSFGWLNNTEDNDKLDANVDQGWSAWWKKELEAKLGNEGYRWDDVPEEFNSWLIFRQLVDIILLNDFLSYCFFALAYLHFPSNQSIFTHLFRWVFGWTLIAFNLWVKIDAHRVVKDYAWYWGDAFWLIVQQEELVFDGVYEIAPHPMYSVGYAGYYGLSIVTGSYTVFFASLIAHAAQFAFLLYFENPHIERIYGGGKKPLAGMPVSKTEEDTKSAVPMNGNASDDRTPSVTDGETDNEWDRNPDLDTPVQETIPQLVRSKSQSQAAEPVRLSMRELSLQYLQRPAIIFANIDLFRATDFTFTLLVGYAVLPAMFSSVVMTRPRLSLAFYFLHALAWRLFHSFGLGFLLKVQSEERWLVRHFLKHYHYPAAQRSISSESKFKKLDRTSGEETEDETSDDISAATRDAFDNWKVLYNTSLVMTYVSFTCLAWKIYSIPSDWTVSGQLLRHVLGSLLIALHIWSAHSSFEVLGAFGWLYSDFFLVEKIPSRLAYTGIYRFLNNPERSMGGAAFLGLSLISGSKLVAFLAIVSHLSHWWFLSFVEKPHMQKLYGERLRKDGGLTKTLKTVAVKHARKLESKAGRHAPQIKRVVSEVKDTMDRVEERVSGAMEEFLQSARPRLNEVVHDTKQLIQQSREKMIITRLATDIGTLDRSRYHMTVPTSAARAESTNRFHVGQPIRISWNAPPGHSRKDWIGIYRLGSCQSEEITKISSVGKWVPLYDEEWDGNTPVENPDKGTSDAGTVMFDKERLPWQPGMYELRLHHDGKHNVMTKIAPLEIFAPRRGRSESFAATRQAVVTIVALSVDLDPKLIPQSAEPLIPRLASGIPFDETSPNDLSATLDAGALQSSESTGRAPLSSPGIGDEIDDFAIMDEHQVKRITSIIKQAFDVELSIDMILANTNVSAITKRVRESRRLIDEVGTNTASG